MSHFEVIRTADEQFHATFVSNGRTIWWTENYRRMVGAEKAILTAARGLGWGPLALTWNVEGVEKAFLTEFLEPAPGLPTVLYVDDRLVPVARPELPEPSSL